MLRAIETLLILSLAELAFGPSVVHSGETAAHMLADSALLLVVVVFSYQRWVYVKLSIQGEPYATFPPTTGSPSEPIPFTSEGIAPRSPKFELSAPTASSQFVQEAKELRESGKVRSFKSTPKVEDTGFSLIDSINNGKGLPVHTPPQAPRNVEVRAIGGGQAKGTWEPPVNAHNKGVCKYVMEIKRVTKEGLDQWRKLTKSIEGTEAIFRMPWDTFCFRVAAVNLIGMGPFSAECCATNRVAPPTFGLRDENENNAKKEKKEKKEKLEFKMDDDDMYKNLG